MSKKGHRRRNAHTSPFRVNPQRPAFIDPDEDPYPDDPTREFVKLVRARIDKPRFVYFIQEVEYGEFGDKTYGPVKIGEAFDPYSRMRELQCGNPRDLELRAVIFATEDTEESLHFHWSKVSHVRGEWFGGGMENAIVTLAQRAQRFQHEGFEQGEHAYSLAKKATWIVGVPQIAGALHGIYVEDTEQDGALP